MEQITAGNLIAFTYTDAKGKVTNRVAYVEEVVTNKSILATDLSELDEEAQALYYAARSNLAVQQFPDETAFISELEKLNAASDVFHRLRNFKPSNITNLKIEG